MQLSKKTDILYHQLLSFEIQPLNIIVEPESNKENINPAIQFLTQTKNVNKNQSNSKRITSEQDKNNTNLNISETKKNQIESSIIFSQSNKNLAENNQNFGGRFPLSELKRDTKMNHQSLSVHLEFSRKCSSMTIDTLVSNDASSTFRTTKNKNFINPNPKSRILENIDGLFDLENKVIKSTFYENKSLSNNLSNNRSLNYLHNNLKLNPQDVDKSLKEEPIHNFGGIKKKTIKRHQSVIFTKVQNSQNSKKKRKKNQNHLRM